MDKRLLTTGMGISLPQTIVCTVSTLDLTHEGFRVKGFINPNIYAP